MSLANLKNLTNSLEERRWKNSSNCILIQLLVYSQKDTSTVIRWVPHSNILIKSLTNEYSFTENTKWQYKIWAISHIFFKRIYVTKWCYTSFSGIVTQMWRYYAFHGHLPPPPPPRALFHSLHRPIHLTVLYIYVRHTAT